MKVAAILLDTARELLFRRTLVVYTVLVTLVLALFALALRTDVADGVLASVSLFGAEGSATPEGLRFGGAAGEQPSVAIESFVGWVQFGTSLALYGIGVLLSVFATAGLIPRMLEPGTIDLLLSKPVGRARLFLARALGGLLAASANLVYMVVGLGVILALKTGVWNAGFFLTGLLMAVYFGCLLGFMALAGVLFRSAGVTTMLAAAIFVTSLVVRPPHENPGWMFLLGPGPARFVTRALVEVLYHVLPRTYEFGQMALALILDRGSVAWGAVLGSVVSGAGALGLATWIFCRRDY